jgi:hypothetical protein
MGKFYIHKVGHQEMGSINRRGERPARGRYFLVAKACLDFFPHISSVVMNDKVIVSIIPMINGREKERVLCTMDYHNQKYADIEYTGKNPRDEVRLYMNKEIDPDKEYFFKGDYAVFERFDVDGDTYYTLTRITPEHKRSNVLQRILDDYDKRWHANAVIDTVFDFIETPVFDSITDVIVSDEAMKVIKSESDSLLSTYSTQDNSDENENSFEESMGCSIFNSSLFHDLVMNAYQYRCAVTGKVIRYKEGNVDLFNLEAAHIKPQAHQGTFLPCNGIALSRDMHFAFDKGFFSISDDYKVIVSEKLKGDWFYEEFNGKKIFVPKEPFYRPLSVFLKHHRENVFDKFRQIRKMSAKQSKDDAQEFELFSQVADNKVR